MANPLTKKLGPLKGWQWATIVGGLGVGYYFFRGRGSSSAATSQSGYTTDAYGNVYDANGNLVSSGDQTGGNSADSVGMNGGGGGGYGGVSLVPVQGGAAPTAPVDTTGITEAEIGAISDIANGAIGSFGGLASEQAGALGDIGTTQAAALGDVSRS